MPFKPRPLPLFSLRPFKAKPLRAATKPKTMTAKPLPLRVAPSTAHKKRVKTSAGQLMPIKRRKVSGFRPAMKKPKTAGALPIIRRPPHKSGRARAMFAAMRRGFRAGRFRGAGYHLARVAPLDPLHGWKQEARQIKKRHKLDAAISRTRQAAPLDSMPHTAARPLPMGRAELWAWYKATGRSWAQFISDHGLG